MARKGIGGPAHLVEVNETRVLLDCGESVSGQMQHLDKIFEISHVILTHLHPDHLSGLFCLLQNSIGAKRKAPLEILLPEEGIQPLWAFLDSIYLYRKKFNRDWFHLSLKPLESGAVIENCDIKMSAWKSDHFLRDQKENEDPRPAFGITVDSGSHRLVYTGDISSIACFIDQLQENTCLLSEGFHIPWKDVVSAARDKNLKKIIFTHLSSNNTSEIENFCKHNSDTFLAMDGKRFEW